MLRRDGLQIDRQFRIHRRQSRQHFLPQHRDEISHHVHQWLLDAEQEGVQVLLADTVADLAGQSRIELIFGDRVQHGAAAVRVSIFRVERHVQRFDRDRLVAFIDRDLFWLETAEWPFRDPTFYSDRLDPNVYIAREYAPLPLEKVREAHQALEGRKTTGCTILTL